MEYFSGRKLKNGLMADKQTRHEEEIPHPVRTATHQALKSTMGAEKAVSITQQNRTSPRKCTGNSNTLYSTLK